MNDFLEKELDKNKLSKLATTLSPSIVLFLALAVEFSSNSYLQFPFLWAEDGTIFAPKSPTEIPSFSEPYAGYLHTYNRIVAFIAMFFPAEYMIWVFLVFTLFAKLFVSYVIVGFLERMGVSRSIALIVLAIYVLQPMSGSLYFNLTNVQWWLGTALILLILQYGVFGDTLSIGRAIVLSILVLSGPFILFSLPVILAYLSAGKNSFWLQPVWIISSLGFLIQGSYVLATSRVSILAFDLPSNLGLRLALLLAILIVSAVLGITLRQFMSKYPAEGFNRNNLVIVALLVVSLTTAFSALAANQPLTSNRYTWIPTALILFAIALVISRWAKPAKAVFLLVLATVVFWIPSGGFKIHETNENINLRWIDRHGGTAAINPLWDRYPAWIIQRDPSSATGLTVSEPLNISVEDEVLTFSGPSCGQNSDIFALSIQSVSDVDARFGLSRRGSQSIFELTLIGESANRTVAFESPAKKVEIFEMSLIRGEQVELGKIQANLLCDR